MGRGVGKRGRVMGRKRGRDKCEENGQGGQKREGLRVVKGGGVEGREKGRVNRGKKGERLRTKGGGKEGVEGLRVRKGREVKGAN